MTTILDRYIFRNVLFSSLAAVGVCAFVLLVANVVKDLLKAFASEQIEAGTFFHLTFILLPYVVAFALPLGLLTGILLVLGRLSAQQEITAMRAAGWGLPRIARPIFVLALLGTALSLWFNCEVSPRARSSFNLIMADAVRTNPLSFIVPHEFVNRFPGYVIYVSEKNGPIVKDLSIWNLDEQGRVKGYLRAESGSVEFDEKNSQLLITPRRGVLEIRDPDHPEDLSRDPRLVRFAEWQRIPLALEHLVGKDTYKRKLSIMTFGELRGELAKVERDASLAVGEREKQAARIRFTMQKQMTLAAGVLAFALIGVPLGIKMQRKETSANLGLAVVLALSYLFSQMLIDWTQKRPELHPELLVWMPSVVFSALGLWLFWRVDRR